MKAPLCDITMGTDLTHDTIASQLNTIRQRGDPGHLLSSSLFCFHPCSSWKVSHPKDYNATGVDVATAGSNLPHRRKTAIGWGGGLNLHTSKVWRRGSRPPSGLLDQARLTEPRTEIPPQSPPWQSLTVFLLPSLTTDTSWPSLLQITEMNSNLSWREGVRQRDLGYFI